MSLDEAQRLAQRFADSRTPALADFGRTGTITEEVINDTRWIVDTLYLIQENDPIDSLAYNEYADAQGLFGFMLHALHTERSHRNG